MQRKQSRRIIGSFAAAILLAAVLIFSLSTCRSKQPLDPMTAYRPDMRPEAISDLDLAYVRQLPRYWITFTVNYKDRLLRGEEVVRYIHRTDTPVRDIYFRLYPNLSYYGGSMEVNRAVLNGSVVSFDYSVDTTALHIPLATALGNGEKAIISLRYTLKAPAKPDNRYTLFGLSQSVLNLPLSYPILAVYTPGGWALNSGLPMGDTLFSEAALYHVTATYSRTLTAIHPGIAVARKPMTSTGEVRETYVTGPVREFAFFLSPNYHFVEKNVDGVRFRSYYLTGDGINGNIASLYGMAVFRIYQKKFGFYPYRTMNVVEAPITYRGMEYANLALLGTDLYRGKHAHQEFLLSHEMGHQWWYNMVGNDQVTYPWLDEGLTEYSTTAYFEEVYGRRRAEQIIHQRWEVPWQSLVQSGLDAIVNQPESAFRTGSEYETIVYGKGALFFNALRQQVGDETYYRILHTYWLRYKYKTATPEDFLSVAEEVSGENLHGLYRKWVLSTSSG